MGTMWLCSYCSQFLCLHILIVCLFGVISSSQQIPHSIRYHLKDVRTAEEFKNLILSYSSGQNFHHGSVNDNMFENEDIRSPVGSGDDDIEMNLISKPKRKDGDLGLIKPKLLGLRGRARVTRRSPPAKTQDGLSSFAEFPECIPRVTIVDVPKGNDPNVIYWPPCVTLQKCSGCCTSDLYECTAVETRQVVVNVLKYLPNFGDRVKEFEDYAINMEQDESCQCLCKVQEKHCNLSIHRYAQCSCQCIKGKQICPETMYWDTQTCTCVCNATPQQRVCSRKRQVFNEESCQCGCKKHARERCQLPKVFNEMKCKCEEVLQSKTTPSLQISKCVPVICPVGVNFNLKSCQCEEDTETTKYTTKTSVDVAFNRQP